MGENDVRLSEYFAPIAEQVQGVIVSGMVGSVKIGKNLQTNEPKYTMQLYTGERQNWNLNVSRIRAIVNNWGTEVDFRRTNIAFVGRVSVFNGELYLQSPELLYSEALDNAGINY